MVELVGLLAAVTSTLSALMRTTESPVIMCGGVGRLGLAAQYVSDADCEAAKPLALGVDEKPLVRCVLGFRKIVFIGSTGIRNRGIEPQYRRACQDDPVEGVRWSSVRPSLVLFFFLPPSILSLMSAIPMKKETRPIRRP
jgi:hypothetical protein